MKFLEEQFKNLSFGTLADLTKARFNKLHESLDEIEDEQLCSFYSCRESVRTENREKESVQEDFRQQAAERLLQQVRIR